MIFINLDSFQLPSAESSREKDSEGGMRVKGSEDRDMEVLLWGQKVKPESPDSERKSKYCKKTWTNCALCSGIEFLQVKLLIGKICLVYLFFTLCNRRK